MKDIKKSTAALAAALIMTLSCVPAGVSAEETVGAEMADNLYAAVDTESADAEVDIEENAPAENTNVTVGDITSFTVGSVTTEGYTMRWNTVEGADGYHVYAKKNGSFQLFKTTTGTGLKIKVKPGAKNSFRVCAYKNSGSGTIEGNYLEKQFTSKPGKVEKFEFSRTKRGGLVFKWTEVERASKYQLFYSTEKDGTYTLFKEVAAGKAGVSTSMMPKGKNLYFKMRAVSTAKDNTANGACSSKLNATVFNTLTIDTIMDRYSNSRSVKLINAQGFRLSESSKQNLKNQLTYLGGDAGYILYDIDSGTAVAYNANQTFMPASSIKAPFMMYGLKRMDEGYSNLDTYLTYTAAQQTGGTGIIQNSAYGTKYKIRTLYEYIAEYSDNVAYYMLQDHFTISGYNNYISSLGCKTSLTSSDRWGVICACDAAREWDDIWTYLRKGPQAKFARKILSSTCAANFRNELGGRYTVYEKSGWTDGDYGYHNETALVRAEHPYIIICLSNRSSSQRMMNIAEVSETIHNEMWKTFKEGK